jgi:hypothetical protein
MNTFVTTEFPISLHFADPRNPDHPQDLVIYDGRLVAFLQYYFLAYDQHGLRSKLGCVGPFPQLSAAPPDALSNSSYPLRVRAGQNQLMVTLMSRPLTVKQIHIDLHEGCKRQLRLTLAPGLPREVIAALVDLGCEVVEVP